ncbi:MAG TPA: alpha-glucosidase [Pyrinomonadaceae bacterium]
MRKLLRSNLRANASSALLGLALILLGIGMFPLKAKSQVKLDAEGHQWWQHAVFYEIYPRSFADSSNNGIGDLNGITEKLDYLKDLGIDAIWLTPCYPSPQVDFGYDVSDYQNIDPMYGTLADFDRLASEAKKRNIRIIMDFVMNHTSDQHAWFKESKSSKDNPKRDWYIWRDGKGRNQPPNNWLSTFGGSAWKFDPITGQWYYHFFYPEQPDLNWRNPEVEKAMFGVTSWWYERGVAGFRLDAVDTLFEDPDLKDNPVIPGKNQYGDPKMQNLYNTKLPELHGVLQRLRQVADKYDAVLIGETWTKDIHELKQYYGEHSNELQMPMDFLFARVDKLSVPEFRAQIAGVNSAGWPVYVLSNHDIIRAFVRYGDGVHNDAIAKLMAGLYLTLRGTPIMYYGEEIGMTNNDPKRREDVKDPIGRLGWPKEKGRDGERTPMQWNTSANAGFSQATPWLPVPASYKTHNVETELKAPDSILNFYRHVLALRHQDPALRDGEYVSLNENDPNVLSYLRRYKDEAVLVVLNMSSRPQKVSFNLHAQGLTAAKSSTLLTTGKANRDSASLNSISLEPFSVYIGKIEK